MNFNNLLSSNDLESFNKTPKRIKNKSNILQNQSLMIVIAMSFISIVFLFMIGIIIIKFFQCRQLYKENNTQIFLNDHQRDIVEDIQQYVNKLQEEKEQLGNSINQLQYNRDKSLEYYQTLTNQRINDNDIKLGNLKALIIEGNDKNNYLKTTNSIWQENLNSLEIRGKNLREKKQKLYEKMTMLERTLDSNDDRSSSISKYGSNIIITDRHFSVLKKWITNGRGFMMNLIYEGTQQKNSIEDFYKSCSDSIIANTLVVMKVIDGTILGGFTYNNWGGNGFKADDNAFVFNLTQEKMYRIGRKQEAIYVHQNNWPIFGHGDLMIEGFDKCSSDFPISYGDHSEKFALTGGVNHFKIEKLEVFTLFKSDD